MPNLDRFAVGLADSQAKEPRVVAECACGCGEEILEGYKYLHFDGDWFVNANHLADHWGAERRVAE